MFETFCLGVALAVGQPGPATLQPVPLAAPTGRAAVGDELPTRIPPALPTVGVPTPTPIPDGTAGEWVARQKNVVTDAPAPTSGSHSPSQATIAGSTLPWDHSACCGQTKSALHDCPIVWLRPWKCEDLEMKPFEPVQGYCGCCGLFWCPPAEEKNGNGEKKNGNGNGEKKNGQDGADAPKVKTASGQAAEAKKEDRPQPARPDQPPAGEEKKEEKEAETLTPLMQAIQCASPGKYAHMKEKGDNLYGWIWAGYTANFDSPRDRINFGIFHNWRSNDVRLDQLNFVYENVLEHEKEVNFGYRVDFQIGHHAPIMVANGLFSNFTGFDPTSGFGVEGPPSFRNINRIGIDLPQFYANAHLPGVITEKGVDVLAGKFYTLMGREVYPAPLTEFYSRSYEIMYATPFTHLGVLGTLHATDTVDMTAGIVRGWDVFEDNNGKCSFTGNVVWTSCDKRYSWTTAWITGPEQFQNNQNYRSMVSSFVTAKYGTYNEWTFSLAGHYAFEQNAIADSATGGLNDAEWYGLSGYAFYTIDPRVTLGTRVEVFRDDDGTRTALTRRPGFAANFYEWTMNVQYRPYQNLRFRPELRFDYADGKTLDGLRARPYNDQRDRFQTTAAIDVIWEF